MDVLNSNVLEVLPVVQKAIAEADFIAIDTELTGLCSDDSRKMSLLDDIQERYTKLRHTATENNFLIIQYGVCPFVWRDGRYLAQPFNFYVFPRPLSRVSPDPRFLCQSSSIDFLVRCGFDFNKLFREGVSYLTLEQVEAERKRVLTKEEPRDRVPVGKNQPFMDSMIQKIEEWLSKTEEKTLSLPQCNAFLRLLLFQELAAKYKDRLFVESVPAPYGSDKVVVLTRVANAEEKEKLAKEKAEQEEKQLRLAEGFGGVMKLLVEAKKPIIGHNMLLDLCMTVSQFCKPLPEDVTDFKKLLTSLFPRLFDTKYVAQYPDIAAHASYTGLGDLSERLKSSPFEHPTVDFPEGFDKYSNGTSFHEAGYDAYVTGLAFATMCKFLGKDHGCDSFRAVDSANILTRFTNRFNLMRSRFLYFGLDENEEATLPTDHMFVVSDFPASWRNNNIIDCFAGLFPPKATNDKGVAPPPLYIRWVSDVQAIVVLAETEREKAAQVMPYCEAHPNADCHITSFAAYITLKKVTGKRPFSDITDTSK
eukprot:TRINITY_DN6187_c1_g1_i1.p1 TRINITY_DN6187_c1_g1~~TRINITY_DN6187_c1_g1_i1.p1  ORF type:complete len:534 (+),score=154.04 TRINITY_DN6187_c1_g1_i1:249-1850(+)